MHFCHLHNRIATFEAVHTNDLDQCNGVGSQKWAETDLNRPYRESGIGSSFKSLN